MQPIVRVGGRPFTGAAAKGDTQIVRYLISKGANVNAVDRFGDSPLELAVSNNQDATANLLVELGAKRIKGTEAQREKAIDDQVQEQIHGSRNR
jgi:ankyrin repeat protein